MQEEWKEVRLAAYYFTPRGEVLIVSSLLTLPLTNMEMDNGPREDHEIHYKQVGGHPRNHVSESEGKFFPGQMDHG